MLLELFKRTKKCEHLRVTPDLEGGYCPDCGEYVVNEWYITRCACCGVKHKAVMCNGEITADVNFCPNCGTSEFIVEKLDKINFIDINFAVVVKKVVNKFNKNAFTQTWVDESYPLEPKMISCK